MQMTASMPFHFAERLRIALDHKRWNYSDLARVLGVSRAAVAKWGTGNDPAISRKNLRAAAEALDISEEWLRSGAGEMFSVIPNNAAEGLLIKPDDIPASVARPILAAMHDRSAECWQLETDALDAAGYLRGDYLIVDLKQRPKPRDIVLAMSNKNPVFRLLLPPYLFAATIANKTPARLTVDNLSIIVRGVVVARFSVS